ncbi:MAG: DNA polymerase III [Spirochaetaceae bacterium]|jgi:DNA polymerase-3 subunit gamma/tau|nr:DNA polymerase III [Spirochaetaceae bacterium]
MFEQIFAQPVTAQLRADKTGGTLAPSMLFAGPSATGKGTAGLELARVLSCENPSAPADCPCAACGRHRLLAHPDLLCLGPRNFSSEISAAGASFLRIPQDSAGFQDARRLFIRSVRKLLVRFAPVLWEEEPKFSKLRDTVLALEEGIDDFFSAKESKDSGSFKKKYEGILKTALKLEADGISDAIPIGQIRQAAAWSHIAPLGPRKLLLIENADRMQEGARNSLLKILEEPPENVTILLTTARERALLPTILSRVRPYRFFRPSPADETAIIRQVFQDNPPQVSGVAAYLDSFLPVPEEKLRALAGFFGAFLAGSIALALRKRKIPLPNELVAFGTYTTGLAEAADLGKPEQDTQAVIAKVLAGTEKFEIRGLFSRFLHILLTLVSESRKNQTTAPLPNESYRDMWRKHIDEAAKAVGIYNQSPILALERLAVELKRAMTRYFSF